jgi:dimethylaniline monooxygenase (N-oxide forming)
VRQTDDSEKAQGAERSNECDVCVIGAGFSGLAAARALRQRDISFTCLEQARDIGGVWRRFRDGEATPAYRSLHLNTSRKVTAYTGFAMPESYPWYPRYDQVAAYLNRFADHCGLREYVECNTEVTALRQNADETWTITTRDRTTGSIARRRFGHVVVAAGYHWKPHRPDISGSDSFPGRRLHSMDYVAPEDFRDQRVVVVGIGNSACDIAVELSRVAAKTMLAVRRGAHVVPKQMLGIPIDDIASRRWWSWLPFRAQRRLIELLLRIIRGPVTSYGLPEPDHRIFSAPVTISDELLSRLAHGAVTVTPNIDHFDSSVAHFTDGTHEEVDAVIQCTGYTLSFGFVPREVVFSTSDQVALYRRVVPPYHRRLYFLGLIRPVGSATQLVESQAEWVADLVEGVAALPTTAEMAAEVEKYLQYTATRYGTRPGDSIHVDFPPYLRAIGRERAAGQRRQHQAVEKRPEPTRSLSRMSSGCEGAAQDQGTCF